MKHRIGTAAPSRTSTTQADEALRRATAETIAGLIAQLRCLNTGMATDPDLIIRLVDGRTGEHLANAFADMDTAQTLCSALEAQANGNRLRVVGGDR